MNLSENERQVYDFIRKQIDEGYPPTVREICSQLGFRSTSTAHRYIASLTRKGLIEKGDKQNRAIRLAGQSGVRIPLVGVVTAGKPITAIEDITDYISFQPHKNYPGELFALKVSGLSMKNAGILDGDIVVADKNAECKSGDIVIGMVEDSATVKRLIIENGRVVFMPENPDFSPIYPEKPLVLGKVIGSYRKY